MCFHDSQDHAYEAVTELNDEEEEGGGGGKRRETAAETKPPTAGVTPSGSSASRERIPSPPIEQSPEDVAVHEYSHIEEPDEDRLRFDGPSSFRSFVDEAFGLNGLTEEQRKARDSSQIHLQFPQMEEQGEGGEEAESKRDEDACAINVRSFMTDSDVTDDVAPICDDAVGTGSGPESRDITPANDVIIAKEIVKSLIQDAIQEAAKVPESTVVQAEVHSDADDAKYSGYSAEEKTEDFDRTCAAEETTGTQVRVRLS